MSQERSATFTDAGAAALLMFAASCPAKLNYSVRQKSIP